ncbi:D-alanyl-D-alanine dipeptidase [Trichormus variabilis ARAD]|uniref:D-alanyl-D-alanine dipeptidase n=1 Tax=Trichormus variabilis N2B TaxID=2681315 RepID=A0ABR6S2F2_ANAVA|nr:MULTISPECIES: M15 family metallopeptidase [Nostocaceae]MBC1212610.1 D-alanyl-D-alanine dipeptidase [Trichormus variabilis ARAD]MBC1255206.1 D-alanyl-D-alanine dipeptidase [Trichormus variabilis V5]MBC1265546.1 D-alanyl-D-alanine dipeptidase [Trichormus variabilis FSR]MBC1300522.1 D-alanyl-D-alanine dipeptidase [Trichormus variabilis N2B]MBC1309535.1 D-alanyl-D-alanine dipeptidase [Trichormus variabilis PNB]
MRPYHQIPIAECGEALVEIPLELFAWESPHPYAKLGAAYGEYSPYFLRQSVVNCLTKAQSYLESLRSRWRIQIFDAYRPVAVQQFMVDYSFALAVEERGLIEAELTPHQRQEIWQAVYEIWAVPSLDEKTPPPHSTGAAVDVTLVDDSGQVVNMGSPIDELSERSHPDYYANNEQPAAQEYHAHRQLLCDVMLKAGFQRNPKEWWHFCYGDQMWAWLNKQPTALYGRVL